MIIIKQGDDKKLEVFDIPDNILQEHQLGSADVAHDSCLNDKIDLYKMEYERCAQRYDDLYKAAWTNFSYMALIAGAILTFGSDSFMPEVSIFLACLPLLFWWAASFEPLNHYGDQVQMRLVGIESVLNRLCQLKHVKDEDFDNNRGLRHFKDFEKRAAGSVKRWKWWLGTFIWVFGLLIALDRLGLYKTFWTPQNLAPYGLSSGSKYDLDNMVRSLKERFSRKEDHPAIIESAARG